MQEIREQETIRVVKADGTRVPFDPDRIRESLRRAGASSDLVEAVLEKSMRYVVDGMTTRALYREVFRQLKKLHRNTAGRYHLKRAIMELGPSGFPFESLIAELLKSEGYEAEVDRIVEGHCVRHEVDVVAENGTERLMVECKFHSDQGRLCDVKHALYVHARFLDVEKRWRGEPGHDRTIHQGWLVTNTRFSGDAIQYGECSGLALMSWDYPSFGSLRERIDRHRLYPITCLTTLTGQEKQTLLAKRIVLSKAVCERPGVLKELRLSPSKMRGVMNEAHMLCEAAEGGDSRRHGTGSAAAPSSEPDTA